MAMTNFFSRRKTNLPNLCQDEIIIFYKMLLKMQKKHPKLNVNKIMKKLYPNFKWDSIDHKILL
jgi:hypothetical protein